MFIFISLILISSSLISAANSKAIDFFEPIETEPESSSSSKPLELVDVAQLTLQNYYDKILIANNLRGKLATQLARLALISDDIQQETQPQQQEQQQQQQQQGFASDIQTLAKLAKKTFDQLNIVLKEFVPNNEEALEIMSSFKHMIEQENEVSLFPHNVKRSGSSRPLDWLKRNVLRTNYYEKVPVIRNGRK
jgi:hypothetical protein